MAKGKAVLTEVEKVIKITDNNIHLELTREEAWTLYVIGRKIGGDPLKSLRRNVDSISEEINKVYPEFGRHDELPLEKNPSYNGLYFEEDNTEPPKY